MNITLAIGGQTLPWWDLVPALGGAIIGALAGGIPAWWLARRNSNEMLARDAAARTDQEKAGAFRVSFKLLTIINSIHEIRDHLRRSLAMLEQPERSHMEPWQVVIPLVGLADEGAIQFEADEMAVFYAAGEKQFLMDLMLLGRRHAASFSAFQTYCEKREALVAVAPTPFQFEGTLGSAEPEREEYMRLQMYTIPLNMLLQGLSKGLEADWELAKKVSHEFGPIVQRYFNDSGFVALEVPNEEEGGAEAPASPSAPAAK